MNVINQISGMAIDHIEGTSSYGLRRLIDTFLPIYKAQALIESGRVADFVKESGVWKTQSEILAKLYDESGEYSGIPDLCQEIRLNIALIRPASKYFTFEFRGYCKPYNETNPETGAQLSQVSLFCVFPGKILNTGELFAGHEDPTEDQRFLFQGVGSTPISAAWTTVTLDWSELPALGEGYIGYAIAFLYQQQGSTIGYGINDFDFSLDWVEFRNIRTSPPTLVMYPILLGSKSSAINTAASMTLTPSAISYFSGKWNDIPSAAMQFFVNLLGSGVTRTALAEAAEIVLSASNPAYSWAVPRYQLGLAQIIYTMTLTGSPDVEIPISSFQSVVRQGGATVAEVQAASDLYTEQLNTLNEQYTQGQMTEQEWNTARSEILADLTSRMVELNASRPSYLSCVIPNFVDYIDEILSRQDGEIIIKKGYRMPDGSRNLEEIVRGNFEYVTYDQGGRSASAQITAYKSKSYYSSGRRTVTGVSYVGMDSQGRRRIRCAMDLFLRPQDICVFGAGINDVMTVGTITYTVSDRSAVMQVTEQDESF